MKRTQTTHYSRALIAILVIAVFLSYAPTRQHAQSTSEQSLVEKGSSKADVYQAVLDLTNPWTVICVAAHGRVTGRPSWS